MPSFWPSANGIATGDAPAVGIHYVEGSDKHPPLRIFYPATMAGSVGKQVGYFQDTSAAFSYRATGASCWPGNETVFCINLDWRF